MVTDEICLTVTTNSVTARTSTLHPVECVRKQILTWSPRCVVRLCHVGA